MRSTALTIMFTLLAPSISTAAKLLNGARTDTSEHIGVPLSKNHDAGVPQQYVINAGSSPAPSAPLSDHPREAAGQYVYHCDNLGCDRTEVVSGVCYSNDIGVPTLSFDASLICEVHTAKYCSELAENMVREITRRRVEVEIIPDRKKSGMKLIRSFECKASGRW